MRMNIFLYEMRRHKQSIFTWSISLTLLLFIFMAMFNSFASEAEVLNQTLAQMPKELLTAFGLDGVDMSTVLGFYSFVFLFCQICLAVQAAVYGFGLVSVEETDLTADFLLAKPVGRGHILTSKFLAAFTSLTLTNLVVWISSFSVIELFREGRPYETTTLLLLLTSLVILQLFFLSFATLLSLLMKRVRSVNTASMALAFGMYALSAFGGMLGEDTFDLLTPFKHFDPNTIISQQAYELSLIHISEPTRPY